MTSVLLDTSISTLLGSLAGIVVGIFPGVGPLQFLMIAWPLFQDWSALQIICFYIGLVTVSQYVDIIPSVFFGVAGESGAIPAAKEGPHLVQRGLAMSAIRQSAIGRTVGCVVAMLVTWQILTVILSNPGYFSVKVQVMLFALAVIGIVASGHNRSWINAVMALAGYLVGMIGFNFYLNSNFLTFGRSELVDGVPIMPLVIGAYAIPTILTQMAGIRRFDAANIDCYQRHIPIDPAPMARGTLIGYFTGMIPGLSYILSSTAAYSLEKWLHKFRGTYRPGDPAVTVASETANSVGAFSTLLPLLLFGIPITASESLVFNAMLDKSAVFSQGQFLQNNLYLLLLAMTIALIIGFIVSWPLAKLIARALTHVRWGWLSGALIVALIALVLGMAQQENLLALYAVVLVLAVSMGVVLRNFDTLPFVFGFLMQNSIESAFFTFWRIYL